MYDNQTISPYVFPGLKKSLINQAEFEKMNRIMELTATYFNQEIEQVISASRKRELCDSRMIISHLCYRYTRLTKNVIASRLGGRDHSTIINSMMACRDRMDTNPDFRASIKDIERLYTEEYA